jgi:2'-5' RNA ligase
VILPVELPPALEALRVRADPFAALGVPAHITILFPFLVASRLSRSAIVRAASIVGGERRFAVTLVAVRRWPPRPGSDGTVWLDPRPRAPFVRLTTALWRAFPTSPPYGGEFETIIPHLTVANSAGHAAEAVAIAASSLPFRRASTELWLIVEGHGGRWERAEVFPLAAR